MPDDLDPTAAGGRRARRKARTRQAILDAAAATFADRGYGRASLEAIARAAEVAIGSVYAHFPGGKQALFLAALAHYLDEDFTGARRAMDAGFPDSTDGHELAGAFAVSAGRHTRTILDLEGWLYTMRHDDELTDQLTAHHGDIHRRATEVVAEHRPPGSHLFDDDELATVAIAVTLGLIQQRSMRPGTVSDDLLGRVLTVLHRAPSPEQ